MKDLRDTLTELKGVKDAANESYKQACNAYDEAEKRVLIGNYAIVLDRWDQEEKCLVLGFDPEWVGALKTSRGRLFINRIIRVELSEKTELERDQLIKQSEQDQHDYFWSEGRYKKRKGRR